MHKESHFEFLVLVVVLGGIGLVSVGTWPILTLAGVQIFHRVMVFGKPWDDTSYEDRFLAFVILFCIAGLELPLSFQATDAHVMGSG